MDESYEERTIRLLLQPSIHLTLVLRHISDEGRDTILHHLANDNIQQLIDFVNETIETVDKVMVTVKDDIDEYQRYFMLQLQLRLFFNELKESYATIRDLYYHKDDSNAMNVIRVVNDVLTKENVPNASAIAQEVYNKLFIENSKKDTVYAMDSDDYLRDLQLLKQYRNKAKK